MIIFCFMVAKVGTMIECWYYLGDYFEIFFSGMGEWGDESSKRNLRSATTTARRDIASGIAVVRSTSDPHRDTPPGGLPAGLSCFVGQERHSPTFAVALGICSLDRANCLWRPLRGERFYLVFFGGGLFWFPAASGLLRSASFGLGLVVGLVRGLPACWPPAALPGAASGLPARAVPAGGCALRLGLRLASGRGWCWGRCGLGCSAWGSRSRPPRRSGLPSFGLGLASCFQ